MKMNLKQRKAILALTVFICSQFIAFSQQHKGELYQDLLFSEDRIIYKGEVIELGPKAFFIDGQLSDEELAHYQYVFNSITEASKYLSDGTEESPMVLYIAPWVYWIDNPDDPAMRVPKEGSNTPFGLEIRCDWLTFFGLTDDPRAVVIASNRGQTMGAKGNFTMLNILGDGTHTENITFGNYCNIDLDYPLKKELSLKKRGSAIVQAQLIFSNGDKILARNTHFVSRLNLAPFWGSKRTLFDRCHFESTDDALNGSAVYLHSTFDFYSSKPFGHTVGTGAVFLNCDIHVFTRGPQFMVKGRGPVTLIDTRFVSKNTNYLAWRDHTDQEARYYQYHVSLNGDSVLMGEKEAYASVDMTGKEILYAYRVIQDNQVIYNTYNLLRGADDWDPMGIKANILSAEKKSGKNYSTVPTQVLITPSRKTLETEKDSILLTATIHRFGSYILQGETIEWDVAPEYQSLLKIDPQPDGTCLVIPDNKNNETEEVIVTASTTSGLEAAAVLYIAPSFLNPPIFRNSPTISQHSNGTLNLNYTLDMQFEDQSIIRWYRCEDALGSNPIEVSVSRFNKPQKVYQPKGGDIGYYIMSEIKPKHLRCHAGPAVITVYPKQIVRSDIPENSQTLVPNLLNMSTKYQPLILPGFWTIDSYAPTDTHEYNWEGDNSQDPWYYGQGVNGASCDSGFVQATKGARLRYTPIGDNFNDMKLSFTAIPAKTAGQGFSSARAQYMDIGIKMNHSRMDGYALRLIRTTKYGDAIDFILMEYKNGIASPITEPVSASCYRPDCKIEIEIKGARIRVHAENIHDYFTKHKQTDVVKVVEMEARISPNTFGGFSFQHTGTVGSGATLIKDLKIEWQPH